MNEKVQIQETSPGAFLKRCRQDQGHSLETVHEATKIPLDVLRGIEEGYKVRTLSPFYYKGFLKLYANYLNVQLENADIKKEELPKYVKQEYRADDFRLDQWLDKNFTPDRRKQLLVAVLAFFAAVIVFKVFSAIAHRPHQVKAVKKASKAEAKTNKPVEKKTQTSKAALENTEKKEKVKETEMSIAASAVPVVLDETVAQNEQPVVRKNVTLTVRAKRDCWLTAKVDGEVLFQSTLRAGAVETWSADKDIEIAGKNINQLEFELNGKMIGTLGREDRGAKKVTVTKDGLQVAK